jgi:hypothetical protein
MRRYNYNPSVMYPSRLGQIPGATLALTALKVQLSSLALDPFVNRWWPKIVHLSDAHPDRALEVLAAFMGEAERYTPMGEMYAAERTKYLNSAVYYAKLVSEIVFDHVELRLP